METPDFYALMGIVQLQSEMCNFTLCVKFKVMACHRAQNVEKNIFNVNYCILSWWMLT